MQTLSQFKALYDSYHQKQQTKYSPRELYDPIDYIMNLGGKRLRPILLLMSYSLFKSDIEKALPGAYAIELFHNFSLMHDDIMDEAPLRRGNPSVHYKYGINSGILSGDAMLILAYQYLTQLKNADKIIRTFNEVAIELCEGQQYDINFEQQSDVSIPVYLEMIEKKTAALLAGAMQIGALSAQASKEDIKQLGLFARKIGIAFQLQDDFLDTFGDPEKFGKKVGGDIIQNKKTYLILKANEIASDSIRSELTHYMSNTKIEEGTKIDGVTTILQKLDIPAYATHLKQKYQEEALEHLAAVKVKAARKQPIFILSQQLLQRSI